MNWNMKGIRFTFDSRCTTTHKTKATLQQAKGRFAAPQNDRYPRHGL
ncbi:hypothetical protein CBM2591_B70002 [Cupriavidus taiwanensis]|nr:hypothetical protein CBM2591_B70002 [Cupriavidus taiwanensis]